MSEPPSDAPRLDRIALERRLDELAALVREAVEPATFFRELLNALRQIPQSTETALWLRTGDTAWLHLTLGTQSVNRIPDSESTSNPPPWVTEILAAPTMTRVRTSTTPHVAGPIHQAGQATGVLSVQLDKSTPQAAITTILPFCAAMADLAGEYLSQRELRALRQERADQQRWNQFRHQVGQAARLQQLAGILAHDGRPLCRADRVTVLRASGSSPRALAVSGVDLLDPRSPAVIALEAFARTVVDDQQPRWFPDPTANAEHLAAWNSFAAATGTKAVVVAPIRYPQAGLLGMLIAERFADVSDPEWSRDVSELAISAIPWWTALEWAERPLWNRWWRQRFRRIVSLTIGFGAVLLIAAALAFIQVPLTITAEGEMYPVHRRDIFATANGLVESVAVKHGDTVTAEQPLVQLRDPATELEAARITGELATARARLSAVQAARLTPASTTGDTTARLQQLAAEEADLQQQVESLTQQQTLIQSERDAWTLRSPIAGQVLTWDVETLLAGRPVERGQVLLTVGDTAGEWEIVARVRERDVGALFTAGNESPAQSVQFLSITEPGKTLIGSVTQIARVTDISDQGESTVRVTIAFDRGQLTQLRSGAAVWPKIDCGQRSLGYVWGHDILNAIRRQIWLRQ